MLTMLPSISCFYVHYNRDPQNFTFIKFEKFVKVILNAKAVIMTIEQLVKNVELFKIFILSLLLTKDTSQISSSVNSINGKTFYGVVTERYWKNLRFTQNDKLILLEKSATRNPLNASEPKRASSRKKLNKFHTMFDRVLESRLIKEPEVYIDEFLNNEVTEIFDYFTRYIEHERKVEMLSVILHNYGRDVYGYVRKFV
jgi:hypothetical protein